MQARQTTHVELQALLAAVWRRKPKGRVLVHSDQGSQFTSVEWASFLKHHDLRPSMSRRGNCHDNAVAESFFNLLERERIRRKVYRSGSWCMIRAGGYRIMRPRGRDDLALTATGDIVVMDNLASQKVPGVREAIAAVGAELLHLPPYSPDFTPDRECLLQVEGAPAKGSSVQHRRPWSATGGLFDAFSPRECANVFADAGDDAI